METELPTKAPCIFKKVDNSKKMCQLTSAVLYSIFGFLDSLKLRPLGFLEMMVCIYHSTLRTAHISHD